MSDPSGFPHTFPGEDGTPPETVDVQAGMPTVDSRVPEDPHLLHLMEEARKRYPAKQEVKQEPSTPIEGQAVPEEQKNTFADTAKGALKLWRDTVHKGGEAFGEGLAGVAGFDPNDKMLGKSGMSELPEGKATKEVGSMAAQGALDSPLFMLAPELGVHDLAAEYLGKGVAEHVAPHAPGLAKILSKAARVGFKAAAGTGEAAAYSAGDAAASGGSKEDVKNAALNKMNLLGGVFGAGHELLGVTHPEGMKDLAGDADNAVASGHSEPVPLDDIQPSAIHFAVDNGKPVLRVMEHRATGAMKHADIPLDEAPGVQTAKDYIKKSPGISMSTTPEGLQALSKMDPKTSHELLTAGYDFDGSRESNPTGGSMDEQFLADKRTNDHLPPNAPEQFDGPPTRAGRVPSPSAVTGPAAEFADTGISPARDNASTQVTPSEGIGNQGHSILAGPDGHVRFEPIPADAPMPLGEEPKTFPLNQADIYTNQGRDAVMGGSDGKPPAPNIPPAEEAKLRDGIDTVRMLMHPETNWKNTAFEGILHDMHRGPVEARALKQKMYAARSLGNEQEIAEALKKAMPDKKFLGAADKSLEQVALGRMSFEQMRNLHPEVGQHMMDMAKSMLDEIRGISDTLEKEYGVVPPGMAEARARGDVDQYLAAIYMAHVAPKGKWTPPTQALTDALDHLRSEHPGATDGELNGHLMKALGLGDEEKAVGENLRGGAAVNRLKAKDTTLHPTVKAVLGEIHSGAVRMAFTLAQQRTILGQLRAWDEIASSQFFSHDPKPGWTHVPPSQMFGKVQDGWLSPEMAGLLQAHTDSLNPASQLRWLQIMGQNVKAGWTVRNPTAQLNNIRRNFKASVMTDGIRFTEPLAAGRHMLNAMKALDAWKKSPVVTDELSAMVMLARQHEALPSGYGRMETMAPGSVFEDMLKELAPKVTDEKGQVHVADLLKELKQPTIWKGVKAADKAAKEFYDGTDQVFKLANFTAGLERLEKRGVSRAEAASIMGRRINESFPNYEHVGPVVDRLRKMPFGSVAPMLSGFTEDIRNNIAYSKALTRVTDPLERERAVSMLKHVALLGGVGAVGTQLRRLNGISDKEVETAKEMRSQAGQFHHPVTYANPFRDANGRVQLEDPSDWLPDLQYAQGDPSDAVYRRVAANLITGPFQSSAVEPAVKTAVAATGLVRPEWSGPKPMEGEGNPKSAIQDYLLKNMMPGVATHGYEALRKAGVVGHLGKYEEKYTPGQAIRSLVSTGIRPVGVSPTSKAAQGNAAEFYGQMKELQDEKKRLFKRSQQGGDLADDPKRFKELRDKNDARVQYLQDRMKRIDQLLKETQQEKGMTK